MNSPAQTDPPSTDPPPPPPLPRAWLEIFLVSLQLGCTSFGGPVAHLGFFRERYVHRLRWLGERDYADLVALCQCLPGPTSSQVGMGIGVRRGGSLGAVIAFAGFTLPSAVLMIAAGYGILALAPAHFGGALGGLKAAAVAVVAQAVWQMGKNFCPDRPRLALALVVAAVLAIQPSPWMPPLMIVLGLIFGSWWFRDQANTDGSAPAAPDPQGTDVASGHPPPPAARCVHPRLARYCITAFLSILLGLPALAIAAEAGWLSQFDRFFRAGSLVFGGGHVVLPLLEREVVQPGLVPAGDFLAGYGLVQAVPGPLFSFAAYLGTVMEVGLSGWVGGLWCLAAIFLPSFLLLLGVLPAWDGLRQIPVIRAGLLGANAAVVGLLLAALYHPVWTTGAPTAEAFALVLMAFLGLQVAKLPAWAVVLSAGAIGALFLQ